MTGSHRASDAPSKPTQDQEGLSTYLAVSGFAVWWENVWRLLWAPVTAIALYASLALFDIPNQVPSWLWACLTLGLIAGLVWYVWQGRSYFSLPSSLQRRARLEQDSSLRHNPVLTLADKPATDLDPAQKALWEEHLRRQISKLDKLKLSSPAPYIAKRDPWGVRLMVGVLLVFSWLSAGSEVRPRLEGALFAGIPGLSYATEPANLDVWVTPPDYTGIPVITLMSAGVSQYDENTRLVLPEGSTVTARLTDSFFAPSLKLNDSSFDMLEDKEGLFIQEETLLSGDQIAVTRFGQYLGRWPIRVQEDQAPILELTQPSEEDSERPNWARDTSLEFDLKGQDDYGITALNFTLELDFPQPFAPYHRNADPVSVTLPRASLSEDKKSLLYETQLLQDFSDHIWAGLPVILKLEATDKAENIGASDPINLTLPGRDFTNPTAGQIAQLRQRLILDPHASVTPLRNQLLALAVRGWSYNNDPTVFLTLKIAANRAQQAQKPEDFRDLADLMWDITLQVEDGGFERTRQRLLQAQQDLMNALQRDDVTDEELDHLMSELEQAMQEFAQEMARRMQDQMQNMPQMPPSDNVISLDEMMQRLRDMAEFGSRDAAQEMLSQLERMMQNMQPMQPGQMQQQSEAQELMQDLQELAQRQQELLDETRRQEQMQQQQQAEQDRQSRSDSQQSRSSDKKRQNKEPPSDNAMSTPLPGGSQNQSPNSESEEGQGQGQGQDPTEQAENQQGGGDQESEQNQSGGADGDSEGEQSLAQRQEQLRRDLGEAMGRMGELTGEIPEALGSAESEMRSAQQELDEKQLGQAQGSEQRALEHLQEGMEDAMQQMQQQMSGGFQFVPQGGNPYSPQNPFGGDGYSQDHIEIPDEELKRSREILRELRRRSGEQGRPQHELDYLDRLLKRFN